MTPETKIIIGFVIGWILTEIIKVYLAINRR